jgi:hypothetical protein
MSLVGQAAKEPVSNQPPQAPRQELPGDAQVLLPLFKTAHPEKCIAQDKQGPPITDGV